MKQEQMKIWERFLKGLLVMTGILFIATGIGYLFRYLGFSEENIIIVYILGVLIIAIITVNRGWSVCYSLLSVLLFNFLFTDPRFTFFSYDYGYPVTFVTVFIAAVIVSNLTIQIRKQGYRAEQMALRTRILLETNQMLQKAKNADEMIEETARHLMRMMGKNVIYYRAEDGILSEPRFCMATWCSQDVILAAAGTAGCAVGVRESKTRRNRNGSVSGCTLPVSGNPKRRHGLWRDRNCSGRDDDGCL